MYVDLKTNHYTNEEKLTKEFPMIEPVLPLVLDKGDPTSASS